MKHPDSVYPGPGRITEKGQVLDGPGLTIYRNVTVRGNTFVANGRFLDVGATEGVAVSANRILTPQGGRQSKSRGSEINMASRWLICRTGACPIQ